MRNQLPECINTIETGILNLDHASGPGTHWVAYKKYKDKILYFDSFGNLKPPIEVIKYFRSREKDCRIIYNHDAYQSYGSVNCGQLCLKFLCQ